MTMRRGNPLVLAERQCQLREFAAAGMPLKEAAHEHGLCRPSIEIHDGDGRRKS